MPGHEIDCLSDIVRHIERECGGRPVFPEASDPRILDAARILTDRQLASPILVGDMSTILAAAASHSVPLDDIAIVDPATSELREDCIAAYRSNRPATKPALANRLLGRPLFFAAALLRAGHADALIAGAAQPTARVLEAGKMALGLADGVSTPSGFFLVTVPDRVGAGPRRLVFADAAINVEPTAEELAEIAIASAATAAKLLGETPRVAMLSFSTHGSARHPAAARVAQATALARKRVPDLAIDGELQVDAALNAGVAAAKLRRPGEVAGRANVLVFPDLSSANIGYKLVQQLAGARAIGPVCQGFAGPLCDLSRGASTDDIVAAATLTLALR